MVELFSFTLLSPLRWELPTKETGASHMFLPKHHAESCCHSPFQVTCNATDTKSYFVNIRANEDKG